MSTLKADLFAKLKEKANHTFGLPVIDVFLSPKSVDGPDGTQHPRSIFTIWTDAQLNKIGYARLTDNGVSEGMVSTGTSDKMTARKVVRTHTEEPAPPPPPPNPSEYKDNRLLEIIKTMGGEGGWQNAIGNELDAILKWAVIVRMQQTNVADAIDSMVEISAGSRTALKSALDPVFDLPEDLDAIIGKWTAAKAKFPKPE
jgi:hypothetical protein|tara:strand:+ start:560 stop:1159 length:600 start_codon:yes stop_codon:yes gene_type:complete